MKKFTFAALLAIATAAFTSCGNGTPSASLHDDIDTLSYAIGMAQTDGIKQYLAEREGVDTAYIDEFLKGLNEGATSADDKKRAAYLAGIKIGQQIGQQMLKGINYELFGQDSTQTVSLKNILAGFAAGTKGEGKIMSVQEAQMYVQSQLNNIKAKNMEKQYGKYKKDNEAFVANYAKQPGVTKLPTGVAYKILKAGNGALPTDTSRVKVHYEGKTIDGNVFDSSIQRGEPIEMIINRTIPGWGDALKIMPVGSKWEVVIPQDRAYGPNGQGQVIKPFSTLVFTIELLEIK